VLAWNSSATVSQKLATQYIPERLILRDAMPATPSGKIQKFRLRDMLSKDEL
jgi:cyclohexanecarboxylate-CoA ligase